MGNFQPAPPADHAAISRLITSLRDSEEQYRRSFELAAVGQAQVDPVTLRFLRVNRKLCEITGFSEAELLEQTIFDLTHPDDREADRERVDRFIQGELEEYVSEKRSLRKDGTVAWVRVHAAFMRDEEGRPLRMVGVIQDITEHKRTEQELRRALDRVHSVLESITEAYFALDSEFRFVEVNPAAIRMVFHRPASELIGRGFWDVFPAGQSSEFYEQYHRAMREQRPIHFEAHSHIVDAWFEAHAYPRDGRLEVYFRDVTDRKRAETELRESEYRLKLALECADAGYWDWDIQTGRAEWSENLYRLIGLPPETAPSDELVEQLVHREDLPRLREVIEASRRTGAGVSIELRVHPPEKGERWLSISGRAILDDEGRPVRVSGIAQDITGRKQAEAAYRRISDQCSRLFEYNLVGVLLAKVSGEILNANDAFLHMLGYTREDLEAGRLNWKALTPPEYHEHSRDVTRELLEHGVCAPFEKEYLRRDGTRVPVQVGIALLENRVEEIAYIIDLTERKRLEDALRQRIEALAEADRRKDEFLAMLAHELRNPLAPILNAVHILTLKGPENPILQRHRAVIARQVEHMRHLLDDLLDVSRITRGAIELKRAPVALASLLAQAVEASRPQIEARRHELSLSLPPGALRIDADATRIVQVFTNLLNNAAKYTGPGGRIRVVVERDGDQVAGRVQDNGIGMSADMLTRAFDLFTQADHSLDRSQGGLGIGLTMVKSLVEMHGGQVTAFSEGPGRGSEFVVRLNLLPDAPLETASRGEEPSAQGRISGSLRVLVVDDNPDAADSLATLIRLWNHETRVALDGTTALEIAADFHPELVLLDIGLPGMDGHELARRLRALPALRDVVLVAISGYGQEDRAGADTGGFDEYYVKPVEVEAIEVLLAKVAGLRAGGRS